MPNPPAANPLYTEAALDIPDHLMVFRSNEDPAPSRPSKKEVRKSSKVRTKLREDTPAPPTKGDGRKRLDLSPLPEDKQLRKKIDFGVMDSPKLEGPKCKGSLFPAKKDASPDSGSAAGAGDEEPDVQDEVGLLYSSSSILDECPNAHCTLVGGIVNLPKMDIETNPLFESCLVPCQVEGSHDALAVGFPMQPMQPKNDTILHLASLDSAELLDTIVAQPLLAGGIPEDDHLTVVAHAHSPIVEMMVSDPPAHYAPPLEEFPPLERGRTLRIRDSFETGVTKLGKVPTWPRIMGGSHD